MVNPALMHAVGWFQDKMVADKTVGLRIKSSINPALTDDMIFS